MCRLLLQAADDLPTGAVHNVQAVIDDDRPAIEPDVIVRAQAEHVADVARTVMRAAERTQMRASAYGPAAATSRNPQTWHVKSCNSVTHWGDAVFRTTRWSDEPPERDMCVRQPRRRPLATPACW
jgi:hypothetical protein